MTKKDPATMSPEELQVFLAAQKPKGKVSAGKMGAYDAWVDMIRKCYDPTYPGYLNHEADKEKHRWN